MLTIPRTPLSMTYHAAIAEYRDEMHHDLETSYRRFALDGSLAWLSDGKDVPTSAQVRGATEQVDLAAFRRRKSGNTVDLESAIDEFFALLAPVLLQELVKGVNAPDQPNQHPLHPHFLSALYHLFYSKAFRSEATGALVFGSSDDATQLRAAWDEVRAKLSGEPHDAAALAGHVRVLCAKLSFEFNKDIWIFCW